MLHEYEATPLTTCFLSRPLHHRCKTLFTAIRYRGDSGREKKHIIEISFVSGAFVMSDSLSAELMGPSVEQCREKREKVENDAEFFWLINLWCEFSNI
jgi:hypothetical protein